MLRRLARSSRGSTIIEFALILPMLMTLGFAIWEFGRLLDATIVSTNAAREGARYAVAHDNDTNLVGDTQTFVYSYLQSGYGGRMGKNGDITITSSQITVTFANPSGQASSNPGPQYRVTVTVPVQAKVFTPFVPGLHDSATLTGVATMQLQ